MPQASTDEFTSEQGPSFGVGLLEKQALLCSQGRRNTTHCVLRAGETLLTVFSGLEKHYSLCSQGWRTTTHCVLRAGETLLTVFSGQENHYSLCSRGRRNTTPVFSGQEKNTNHCVLRAGETLITVFSGQEKQPPVFSGQPPPPMFSGQEKQPLCVLRAGETTTLCPQGKRDTTHCALSRRNTTLER